MCGMPLPESMNVALKEWAVVCDALASGKQIILLRKGGIYEAAGEFELEHREFLLFPTFLHQNATMLKSEFRGGVEKRDAEPGEILISSAARVTDIIQLQSRQQMDAIDGEHIWSPPLIEMRFSYRPQNPLYLLIVRAYRLPEPVKIVNTPAYAGCKSWVPLDVVISTRGALPAVDDAPFDLRRAQISEHVAAAKSQ
jgi:hypothetical protein